MFAGYNFDRPKFNKRFLSIWKNLHNLCHGILTQPAKCRHMDKIITFGCLSWNTFGEELTFNREVKCFTFTCIVLFRFWNLQQPGEQIHMMPSPQKEQSIAQHTRSEKQRKYDSCVISVNETPPRLRYTGLVNQGATCYLNTVLQILFMTKEFREAVERYKPHNSKPDLNDHIAELFKSLKPRNRTTITTERITAELKIKVHKQEDVAKCLQKILNKVDSETSKIFQGKMTQITICIKPAKAHEPLKQDKTFFIISISLDSREDHINVQRCFESYFEPIPMCGEGQQIYCKKCEMPMDTEMSCSLLEVPSVLVLHLERFELDYDTMCCVKNHSPVEIPDQLAVTDEAGGNHWYDLYAIANHSGSLIGGHYYADIRSFEDQQWYRFDDSLVDQCDMDNPLSSEEAYLLLYKTRSGSTEDMLIEDNESKRTDKHTKRANSWSQEDLPKHPKRRRDSEPENPHRNQQIEHTSTDTEDDPDSQSTAREEQYQQNLLNNSGSNTETEVKPSQPLTAESTTDRGIWSPDADSDYHSTPNVPSRHDQRHSENININTEDDQDSQSTVRDEQDQQNVQNNSGSYTESENPSTPNIPSRHDHRLTEHININTEDDHDSQSQSNNGDCGIQSLINYRFVPSSADRASEQSKCSDVSVELEPLNEDQTQSNMNIKEKRGACSPCILSALLIAFLLLSFIIISVIIYNNVK